MMCLILFSTSYSLGTREIEKALEGVAATVDFDFCAVWGLVISSLLSLSLFAMYLVNWQFAKCSGCSTGCSFRGNVFQRESWLLFPFLEAWLQSQRCCLNRTEERSLTDIEQLLLEQLEIGQLVSCPELLPWRGWARAVVGWRMFKEHLDASGSGVGSLVGCLLLAFRLKWYFPGMGGLLHSRGIHQKLWWNCVFLYINHCKTDAIVYF